MSGAAQHSGAGRAYGTNIVTGISYGGRSPAAFGPQQLAKECCRVRIIFDHQHSLVGHLALPQVSPSIRIALSRALPPRLTASTAAPFGPRRPNLAGDWWAHSCGNTCFRRRRSGSAIRPARSDG